MESNEQPTVFMYGVKERTTMPEMGNVGRWLLGEDVPLSADDLVKLRKQFSEAEAYRQLLLDGIMRVSKRLSEQGAESVNAIETPAATHREVYWSGFAAGQVEAYGTAAAAISELHVIAALGVE